MSSGICLAMRTGMWKERKGEGREVDIGTLYPRVSSGSNLGPHHRVNKTVTTRIQRRSCCCRQAGNRLLQAQAQHLECMERPSTVVAEKEREAHPLLACGCATICQTVKSRA